MLILEDLGEFQWFWAVLEEGRRRKSFEHLGDFSEIDRLDLQGVFGPYRIFKRGIGKSGIHETCS